MDFYQRSESEQAAAMAELARAALVHWGLEGSELRLIKYRENAVFEVIDANGNNYALRIHRHAYHSDQELRSELQWMAALNESGILVPTLVPTSNAEPFVLVSVEAVPEPRQIDIFEWVTGRQLGSVEEGISHPDAVVDIYHTLGSLAAKLHNQAVSWTLPKGFVRHAWDVDGLVGENPFWGRFWELEAMGDGDRQLILRARDRVRDDLAAYAQAPENKDQYSMLHADFVLENLMVEGDRVRLIDFDDAGFGWHLFELATALYFEMDEDYFPVACESMVCGYREHRSLSDEQLAQLPLFFLVRAFTYLGWVHTRAETQTARQMTPMLVEKACRRAREYLGE